MKEVKVGDIVSVTWRDHFRYQGVRPQELMVVVSYGKVDEITDEGIAIVQNEVIKPQGAEYELERVMDGQFILRPTIVDVKILKEGDINA